MRKIILFLLLFSLVAYPAYGAPDQLMNIVPSATAGTTIASADENSRNNAISTPYNAHTHNDTTQTTSTTYLFGSGTSSGTNMTLQFGNSASVPAIRWNGTLDAFQIQVDGTNWITLQTRQGTAGQYLQSQGSTAIPQWVDLATLTDRGDPGSEDYTAGDFTIDNTWRDLDLSSIVPAGAVAVLIRVSITDDTVSKVLSLRKNGNSNGINAGEISTQVANVSIAGDMVVACDTNRVIEYKISTGMDTVNLTVAGWW